MTHGKFPVKSFIIMIYVFSMYKYRKVIYIERICLIKFIDYTSFFNICTSMIELIKHCEKCAHILIHALFAIINFSEDCNNFRIHVFVECCDYLVKYFYFCRCEVAATSKQRLGLLGVILIPWWRLICGTKFAR